MKKQVKKKNELTVFRDEIIRHFDVVSEHQDKKIDLVLEQYGDLIKGIETVAREVTIVKEQVEFINIGLKKKVDVDEFLALQRRVDALEKTRK